jgi:hypothetical protein
MNKASRTPARLACSPPAWTQAHSTTPERHVGQQAIHARSIEQGQRDDHCGTDGKVSELEGAGIEAGDHQYGADVIGEEDAQLDRHPASHHRNQGDGKGGVGCHRHAPAVRPGTRE